MATLKNRIERLAAAQQRNQQDQRRLLVQLLARRDALAWPWRDRHAPIPEIRKRLREYLTGKAGTPVKAAGPDDWKSTHYLRQEVIDSGYATACTSGGQITSLILSELGEATARALVGDRLSTLADSEAIFQEMLDRERRWYSESELLGVELDGSPSDWDDIITERMLPLLVAGVVESNADLAGRVAYRLVADRLPESIAVDVEAEPWADELYLTTFDAERVYLSRVPQSDPSEIHIPLASLG